MGTVPSKTRRMRSFVEQTSWFLLYIFICMSSWSERNITTQVLIVYVIHITYGIGLFHERCVVKLPWSPAWHNTHWTTGNTFRLPAQVGPGRCRQGAASS